MSGLNGGNDVIRSKKIQIIRMHHLAMLDAPTFIIFLIEIFSIYFQHCSYRRIADGMSAKLETVIQRKAGKAAVISEVVQQETGMLRHVSIRLKQTSAARTQCS